MRIIAGEFRGRRLLPPADRATRPVTDRVKQATFDWLRPWLDEADHAADAFAGTGSFGLEALSRGVAHCTFFERHRAALERLRRNVETLGVADRVTIRARDLYADELAGVPAMDVAFLDPPYRHVRERREDVAALVARLAGVLAEEGVIVLRTGAADDDVVIDAGREIERRKLGSMTVRLIGRA